jgi:hypothetical protein
MTRCQQGHARGRARKQRCGRAKRRRPHQRTSRPLRRLSHRNQLRVDADEELVRLVTTASTATKIPVPELLEDFGRELVPMYLSMYGHLLKPEWRTLDVVEHTEETIHK